MFPLLCWDQLNRGTLTGVISDPSGAAVSGATITAKHKDTGVSSSTTTTDSGNYTLPALPIGEYQVEFEAPGFKKVVRSKTEVLAGVTHRADVQFELGSVTESVMGKPRNCKRIQPRCDQCEHEAGRGFAAPGEWRHPQRLQPRPDCARNKNSGRLPYRRWTGGRLGDATFGDIRSQGNSPRRMQVVFKIAF